MKISILLFTTFLSWAVFDTRRFRGQRQSVLSNVEATLTLEEIAVRKKQWALRQNRGVIPPQIKRRKKPVYSIPQGFSGKPLDPRFSNQRKLRRMFNNM